MAGVFYFPLIGTPTAEGNLLSFYEAGLDVPLDVWTDSDLTIAWAQPIVINAAGNSDGPIYVSSTPSYKVVYTDANGVAIPGYPVDFVSPSTIVNVMQTATLTFTNAQIKTLPTTPLTLLAASDSGLRYVFDHATVTVDVTAGAYTNIAASAYWEIDLGGVQVSNYIAKDATTTPVLADLTAVLAGGGVTTTTLVPLTRVTTPASLEWGNAAVANATDFDAAALTLSMGNLAAGNLTGGNAANSMTLTVYYTLESVA